ncbi:MAG: hypothetical protein EBX41_03245, partial [Chitinophagia bacterium]|nr:hypothetical protein [Chitinophagia bacterium]
MILRHIAKKIVLYTACLLFILYGGSGSADARVLRLKTQTLTTTPNAAAYFSSVAKSTGDTLEAIIQFNSTITLGDKENYAIKGVKLLNYLPDNAYTAIIYPQRNLANSDINNIYSVTNVEPIWKIDEHTQLSLTAHEKKIKIAVSFHPFVAKEQIVAYCNALNIGIDNNNVLAYNTYKIETDYEAMTKLAAWYGVEYISTDGERVALDLQSNPVVKVNVATLPIARGGYGLSGDSVAVAVGDNGSGAFHVDTKDRVVSFHPAKVQKHGSLVNGLVGGAGTLDPVAIGMAPLCKLIDYSFDQVITHTPDAYTDYNATITNNSYAVMVRNCAYSATYDVYSRYLDSIALQYPYVLHVFASGNDGWMSCSPMPKGYGTVSGGYQPAKNNMTVGSITDYLYQAEDEGRGPCRDGRIKPDMVAVGLRAYTCFGIDIYDWAAGTSIASPHVAGGAALLTQRYKQLNGGRTPRADVLKAILLNGAMDIGNKGPDFCYGFGVLDVLNSVKIIDSNRVIEDSILNSGVKTYTLR